MFFVHCKTFQPCLTFVGKAWSLPYSGATGAADWHLVDYYFLNVILHSGILLSGILLCIILPTAIFLTVFCIVSF
jgi:hypothetical protein